MDPEQELRNVPGMVQVVPGEAEVDGVWNDHLEKEAGQRRQAVPAMPGAGGG